jgi:hypothetical protein
MNVINGIKKYGSEYLFPLIIAVFLQWLAVSLQSLVLIS